MRREISILKITGLFFLASVLFSPLLQAQKRLQLYTPYRQILVTPGQKITYSIQLINNSDSSYSSAISVYGLPTDWSHTLKSGTWEIKRLSVLPKGKETMSLELKVPLKVKKGLYRFSVNAAGFDNLPLAVEVLETGTYRTTFNVDQPDLEGSSTTSFNFNGTIQNATADTQFYALRSEVPAGWDLSFRASGKQVASVKINPNETQTVSIEAKAPKQVKAGKYEIPVFATTATTSAKINLSMVITGNFDLNLSTPKGRLSEDITSGHSKKITLIVTNTGSAPLQDVQMNANTPVDWNVSFDPKKIPQLKPGSTAQVDATITASKNAIAGDYVTAIKAGNAQASANADFRISVHTSALWGWVGILIIVLAVGVVVYLFKKYGRR